MSRTKYWLSVLGMILIGGLILALIQESYGDNAQYVVGRWLGLGIAAIIWAIASFRLRDAGRKEYWSFLVIVPVVNLFAIIAIGLLPSRSANLEAESFGNPF